MKHVFNLKSTGMKVNLTNLQKLDEWKVFQTKSHYSKITKYLTKIEEKNQGFYKIFTDRNFLNEIIEIKNFVKLSQGKYENIVICGIGGSILGTLAIQEALLPKFSPCLPHLYILENIDAAIIANITTRLNFAKTLFIFVSKSGNTIETITQYEFFYKILNKYNLNCRII